MRARELRKLLSRVAREAQAEISGNASRGGMYARGLSSEGAAGGYRDAIYDVMAIMDHGHPSDPRGYWGRIKAEANS